MTVIPCSTSLTTMCKAGWVATRSLHFSGFWHIWISPPFGSEISGLTLSISRPWAVSLHSLLVYRISSETPSVTSDGRLQRQSSYYVSLLNIWLWYVMVKIFSCSLCFQYLATPFFPKLGSFLILFYWIYLLLHSVFPHLQDFLRNRSLVIWWSPIYLDH